ncbi:MAG: hypothetical protein J3Q66DRAFT_382599 [Benniella sp.]|nr:MAG: hypothetical protein J3Q66DRAFT_382599 [Benniella sp.]
MGSHLNLDSFTKLHLPPTYTSPSQQASERVGAPVRINLAPTTTVQPPSYISTITERVKNDFVKQEAETKVPKPRKKRGQYRKTILKQQAAAVAAAAAAGLPPPQFPPLPVSKKSSSSSRAAPVVQPEPPKESTTETHDPQPQTVRDAPSPMTLELESELAMLAEEAEEAEEEKRRREEETADRILKRAQVIKHLRSLRSKLATAQIQIGQDLHNQSIDLFSQLYDEVLEDIGRDTDSELLNLLKDPLKDQDSDQEDPSQHHGYMHTRSSDKPKKRDLVPAFSISPAPTTRHTSEHPRHSPYVEDADSDSDSDTGHSRRIGSARNASQFVGQSWDIGSGQSGQAKAPASVHTSHARSAIHLDEADPDIGIGTSRTSYGTSTTEHKLVLESREDLQRRQSRELDELQLQQRKEYEDFQRRQLDQIRDLQRKHSDEVQRFETAKTKEYQEQLEELLQKRLKLGLATSSRNTNGYTANGTANGTVNGTVSGTINPLPMSTMTLALTAMNEKKKQLKRAMKKQLEMDDNRDKDAEQFDHDSGEQQHVTSTSSRPSTSSLWNRKANHEGNNDIKRGVTAPIKSVNGRSSAPVGSTSEHRHSPQQSQGTRNQSTPDPVSYVQLDPETTEESVSSSPRPKAKKRKNTSPVAIPSKRANDSPSKTASKTNFGFSKTLLGQFEKWNPDEKAENLFDFVLSDPPDIDVDETEVHGLLNGMRRSLEQGELRDLNATPTTSAFKWYQEQQKLAQELVQQSKMAPMQFTEDDETADGPNGVVDQMGLNASMLVGSMAGSELVPGDDPLAAFIVPRRRLPDGRKTTHDGSSSEQQHSGSQASLPDTSSYLTTSSAVPMLFSGGEGDNWNLQAFTMDPTDEYLNHDISTQF